METGKKPRRSLRRGAARFLVCTTIVFLVLALIARFPPIIGMAWQKSRGTSFEPFATRWAVANFDPAKRPVEVALARYRINEGQPIEDVIAQHGPFHVTSYGEYQSLEPPSKANGLIGFESFIIVAKDGRLRFAHWWTCTGHLEFFNSLSKDEEAEFVSLRDALRKKRDEAWLAPQMAIAGGMLYEGIYNISQPIPEGRGEASEVEDEK